MSDEDTRDEAHEKLVADGVKHAQRQIELQRLLHQLGTLRINYLAQEAALYAEIQRVAKAPEAG